MPGGAPSRAELGECVHVCVRVRPLFGREDAGGMKSIIDVDEDRNSLSIVNPAAGSGALPRQFTFDACYGKRSTQEDLYTRSCAPIVDAVLQGFNGTVFAYGQTGAGKTHSMEGSADNPGVMPRSFKHIFDEITSRMAENPDAQHLVSLSYVELYNEQVRDLLAPDPNNHLQLKERPDTGVYVKGLSHHTAKNVDMINNLMAKAKPNRTTGKTNMNAASSRSHAVLTVTVEVASKHPDGSDHIHVGKLNLVDLAGSERQSKTGATGMRLKEATKINLSLAALGNVISSLVAGTSHIPYRDSKLTRLLQDSLGGNTKTLMIAACGPADDNFDESMSTLRYANRAKSIQNHAKINEDPKDAMLREFQDKIKALKAQLMAAKEGGAVADPSFALGAGGGGSGGTGADAAEMERRKSELLDARSRTKEQEAAFAREMSERKKKLAAERADKLRPGESKTAEMAQRTAKEQAKADAAAAEIARIERELQRQEAHLAEGSKVIDRAAKEEKKLRAMQAQVDMRKRQEAELRILKDKEEEKQLLLTVQYHSLEDELKGKKDKVRKLAHKFAQKKEEVKILKNEFRREKHEIIAQCHALTKEDQFKQSLIDFFVDQESYDTIVAMARFDDSVGEWTVPRITMSGTHCLSRKTKMEQRKRERSVTASIPSRQIAISENPYRVWDEHAESGYSLAADAPVDARPAKSKTAGRSRSKSKSSARRSSTSRADGGEERRERRESRRSSSSHRGGGSSEKEETPEERERRKKKKKKKKKEASKRDEERSRRRASSSK